MIIDPESPEAPRRRWPFLVGWCCAAITIVVALFITHDPLPQQPLVTVSPSQVPPAFASVSPNIAVLQVPVSRSRITQFVTVSRLPQGSITYLDHTGTRIAVGPNDNLLIPPDSQTTRLR